MTVAIVGDEIPDETLIGRTAIIHGLTEELKKYSMTMFESRFSQAKCGVMSSVYIAFDSHKRAKAFFEQHGRKCQHKNKNAALFSSIVDLEDGEINYAGSSILGYSYWGTEARKTCEAIFKRKG